MGDEEAVAQRRPQLSVPPPRRVGVVLGWSLPTLGIACLIAGMVMDIRAESAWQLGTSSSRRLFARVHDVHSR